MGLAECTQEDWLIDFAHKLDVEGIDYEKLFAGFSSADAFQTKTHPLGSAAFSRLHPPVTLMARMAQIPWKMAYGVCAEEPDSREPVSGPEEVLLYPYGCTDL